MKDGEKNSSPAMFKWLKFIIFTPLIIFFHLTSHQNTLIVADGALCSRSIRGISVSDDDDAPPAAGGIRAEFIFHHMHPKIKAHMHPRVKAHICICESNIPKRRRIFVLSLLYIFHLLYIFSPFALCTQLKVLTYF